MDKRRAILLFASLGLASANVMAQPADFRPQVWLNAGFLSHHLHRDRGYREDNWGLGGEAVFRRDHAALAGTFINSERHRTRYAAYQWRPLHWEPGGVHVAAGVAVALLDGYPAANNGGWFVAPLPTLSIEYGRIGANIVAVPNVSGSSAALALQLKLRVW